MAKPKIVRIKDRIDNLTNYIIKETKIPKIKFALLKEYEEGNFYSIPRWLYADSNIVDVKFIKRLLDIYIRSDNDNQAVPDGLFNLNDDRSKEIFLGILREKVGKGIRVNFSYFPEGNFSEEEITLINSLKETVKIPMRERYMILHKGRNGEINPEEENLYRVLENVYGELLDDNRLNKIINEIEAREQLKRLETKSNETLHYRVSNVKNFKINSIYMGSEVENIISKYGRRNTPEIDRARFDNNGIFINERTVVGEKNNNGFSGVSKKLIEPIYRGQPVINFNIAFEKMKKAKKSKSEIKELYYKIFKDRYKSEFRKINLEYNKFVNSDVESLLRNKYYTFSENDLLNIENDSLAVDNLEYQKAFLSMVIINLYKTGCFQDLEDTENLNINKINEFLSDENKIPSINGKDLIERISKLDMKKIEDVLEMLTYNRHFTNKLAHNYQDYIYATLRLNSIGNKAFDKKREKKIKEGEKEATELGKNLNRLYTEAKTDSEKRDELFVFLKTNGMTNKQINILLDRNDSNVVNTLNRIAKESVVEFPKQYTDKTVYCSYVYDRLEQIMNYYNQAVASSRKNNLKSPTFTEFVNDFFTEINEVKQQYINLNVTDSNNNKIDVLEEFQTFFYEIKNDGIIEKPEIIIAHIARKMEMINLLYAAKQFSTMSLYNALKKCPDLIYMEHTPADDKEPGVVDVYLEGHVQVFGGHYKDDDPEIDEKKIEELTITHPDVSDGFDMKKGNKLGTSVPIGKLTQKQKDELGQLWETMEYLDEEKQDPNQEKNLVKLDELREFKRQNDYEYNILKVRVALAKGLTFFKQKYLVPKIPKVITLNGFQRKLADLILNQVNKGESLEDIANQVNIDEDIINYCRQEVDNKAKGNQGNVQSIE